MIPPFVQQRDRHGVVQRRAITPAQAVRHLQLPGGEKPLHVIPAGKAGGLRAVGMNDDIGIHIAGIMYPK